MSLKVVTREEARRVERFALERGTSEEGLMEEAGQQVAEVALQVHRGETFTLLIGKGNKGGDAYRAGIALLEAKRRVVALRLTSAEAASPLQQKFRRLFLERGGEELPPNAPLQGCLIDGLLGTGMQGEISAPFQELMGRANRSRLPLLAIDLPSGIDPNSGQNLGSALVATATVALAFPKLGCFLRDGWNHTGQLFVRSIGLPEEAIAEAHGSALLLDPKSLSLPPLVRNRHKYQAGYLLGWGGSKVYAGAAKLASLAALRSGAGLVRLFTGEEIAPLPDEVIGEVWNKKGWNEEVKRARACFIGPGISPSRPLAKYWREKIPKLPLPTVLDAGALLPKVRSYPAQSILTPHRGEALHLLELSKETREEELFAKIAAFCEKKSVILILKGAPTFIFAPNRPPTIVPYGDPGMATAGSGDVLTGVLGALLAQGLDAYEASCLGVYLHAIAGERAAGKKGSHGMIARDLIEELPGAFLSLVSA